MSEIPSNMKLIKYHHFYFNEKDPDFKFSMIFHCIKESDVLEIFNTSVDDFHRDEGSFNPTPKTPENLSLYFSRLKIKATNKAVYWKFNERETFSSPAVSKKKTNTSKTKKEIVKAFSKKSIIEFSYYREIGNLETARLHIGKVTKIEDEKFTVDTLEGLKTFFFSKVDILANVHNGRHRDDTNNYLLRFVSEKDYVRQELFRVNFNH